MRTIIRLIKKTYSLAHPHESRVVLHNATTLTLLQALTYLLPVAIVPYLFRTLGPDKFGLIAFAQAFTQYFIMLTDYGFNVSATKEISLCRDDPERTCRTFAAVLWAKIALAFVSLLAAASVVYFVPRFRNDWPVYALSFGAVAGNALFPSWFFQGREKMRYISALKSIGGIFAVLLLFGLVKTPRDYLWVPLITSAVPVLTGLTGQYLASRAFGISRVFPGFAEIRRQLRAGWDVFISVAAINAYTTTRIFVLGLLTNNSVTGLYTIAEKIANACQTFPLDSFTQSLFPRLSHIFQRSSVTALAIMRRLQEIAVRISLVSLPLIGIAAGVIITIACGGAYRVAIDSLRLLLVGVFFVAANAFRVQFLLVCGETRLYSRIHVTAALVGLPLIVLLVHYFSYLGAALATIILEVGIFAATFRAVRKLPFSQE